MGGGKWRVCSRELTALGLEVWKAARAGSPKKVKKVRREGQETQGGNPEVPFNCENCDPVEVIRRRVAALAEAQVLVLGPG